MEKTYNFILKNNFDPKLEIAIFYSLLKLPNILRKDIKNKSDI